MTASSSRLSVGLDCDDRRVTALHQAVLASVPGRLRVSTRRRADIMLVCGSRSHWLEEVASAIDAGVRGILVAAPGRAAPEQVQRIAAHAKAAGTAVAVDTAYAADRAWRRALPDMKRDLESAALLDSVVTATSQTTLFTALLDQLAVVRPLVGSGGLELVHQATDQYAVSGAASGAAVSLTGIISGLGGEELQVDLVGVDRRWRARWYGDVLARPTELTRYDKDGEVSYPPVYESFLVAWNDYLIALVFLRSTPKFTLPIGLQTFFQQNSTDWGPVMAVAVIMMIPPILVFAILNRFFSVGGIGGSLAGQ